MEEKEKLKVVITTPDGKTVTAKIYAGHGIEYVSENTEGKVTGAHLEPNGSVEGIMSSLNQWLKSYEGVLR